MDIMELIKSRRSIRSFEDKELPKGLIEKIIEAGSWAPSAINMQPWKFIAVTNKEVITDMANAVLVKMGADPLVQERKKTMKDPIFYSAPLLAVILKEKENNWSGIDCALASQNMMLLAHSEGLGSCMIGRIKRIDASQFVKIPEGYEVHSSVVFGYPAETPEPGERKKDILEWVT